MKDKYEVIGIDYICKNCLFIQRANKYCRIDGNCINSISRKELKELLVYIDMGLIEPEFSICYDDVHSGNTYYKLYLNIYNFKQTFEVIVSTTHNLCGELGIPITKRFKDYLEKVFIKNCIEYETEATRYSNLDDSDDESINSLEADIF